MSDQTEVASFNEFQAMNWNRAMNAEKFAACREWSLNDWATALTGEVGEFCNIAKKVRRGDLTEDEARAELAKEMADVITYAFLIMSKMDVNAGRAVLCKFEEVSSRIGWRRQVSHD